MLVDGFEGPGACILIEGDAATGKTALLDEFAEFGRDRGVRVARSAADGPDRFRPFGVVVDALGDARLAERVARMVRARVTPTTLHALGAVAGGRHLAVQDTIVRSVGELVAKRPLMLVVDDLHWADASSVMTLRALGTQLAHQPVFVVGALRGKHPRPEIEQWEDARRITLDPAAVGKAVVPAITGVGDGTRTAIEAVAVIGGAVALGNLALVLGCRPDRAHDLIAPAVSDGWLVQRAGTVSFADRRMRRAVYDAMAASRRSHLHRQAATALRDRAPRHVVAHHLVIGAEPGDREALRWLRGMALQVLEVAPATAAEIAGHALRLAPADGGWLASVLAVYAKALVWDGRVPEGAAVARHGLVSDPTPTTRAELEATLAEALVLGGNPSRATALFSSAARCTGLPEIRRARLQSEAALTRLFTHEVSRARREAELVVARGQALGDPVATATGLTVLSAAEQFGGRPHHAVRIAERAVAVASEHPDALCRAPELILGLNLIHADRIDTACRVVHVGMKRAEANGAYSMVPYFHEVLALCHYFNGAWDEALVEAGTGWPIGKRLGPHVNLAYSAPVIGCIALHRGDLVAARNALADLHAELERPTAATAGLAFAAMYLEALIAEHDGDIREAARLLGGAFEAAVAVPVYPAVMWCAADLVRMLLAAGNEQRARQVAATVARVGSEAGTVSALGTAGYCRGQVERDPDHLGEAAARFHAAGRPFDRLRACRSAAAALAAAGRDDEAEAFAKDAVALSSSLGVASQPDVGSAT